MVTHLSLRMEELHFSPRIQHIIPLLHTSALKAINYKKIFQHNHVSPVESGQPKPSDVVSFIELLFSMINKV